MRIRQQKVVECLRERSGGEHADLQRGLREPQAQGCQGAVFATCGKESALIGEDVVSGRQGGAMVAETDEEVFLVVD